VSATIENLSANADRLVNDKMHEGLRLLGWYKVRLAVNGCPRNAALRPTMLEKLMHKRVAVQVTKQSSAAGDRSAVPVLGCIVVVHREVVSDLGIFAIDNAWFTDSDISLGMLPAALKVQSLAADGNGQKDEAAPATLPLVSRNWQSMISGLDEMMQAPVDKLNDLVPKLLHGAPSGKMLDLNPELEKLADRCRETKAEFRRFESDIGSRWMAQAIQDADQRNERRREKQERRRQQEEQVEQRRQHAEQVRLHHESQERQLAAKQRADQLRQEQEQRRQSQGKTPLLKRLPVQSQPSATGQPAAAQYNSKAERARYGQSEPASGPLSKVLSEAQVDAEARGPDQQDGQQQQQQHRERSRSRDCPASSSTAATAGAADAADALRNDQQKLKNVFTHPRSHSLPPTAPASDVAHESTMEQSLQQPSSPLPKSKPAPTIPAADAQTRALQAVANVVDVNDGPQRRVRTSTANPNKGGRPRKVDGNTQQRKR